MEVIVTLGLIVVVAAAAAMLLWGVGVLCWLGGLYVWATWVAAGVVVGDVAQLAESARETWRATTTFPARDAAAPPAPPARTG